MQLIITLLEYGMQVTEVMVIRGVRTVCEIAHEVELHAVHTTVEISEPEISSNRGRSRVSCRTK
jgi:hypothetical protein